jgi:hypothetical protein
MRVVTVESSTLATVGYDDDREPLQLEFLSGEVYQYFDVPAALHRALLSAPSKGSYFNRAIRGRFAFRLIRNGAIVPTDTPAPSECSC